MHCVFKRNYSRFILFSGIWPLCLYTDTHQVAKAVRDNSQSKDTYAMLSLQFSYNCQFHLLIESQNATSLGQFLLHCTISAILKWGIIKCTLIASTIVKKSSSKTVFFLNFSSPDKTGKNEVLWKPVSFILRPILGKSTNVHLQPSESKQLAQNINFIIYSLGNNNIIVFITFVFNNFILVLNVFPYT